MAPTGAVAGSGAGRRQVQGQARELVHLTLREGHRILPGAEMIYEPLPVADMQD